VPPAPRLAIGLTALLAAAPRIALLAAAPAGAGELLYVSEGNRLHRLDLDSVDRPPPLRDVLIPSSKDDPVSGRDINGMICLLPDGSGRFVAAEDTGQPATPGGWALLAPDGRQLGKLTATARSELTEPYGCAFDAAGRLFTSEVGDPGFLRANGQLIQWFAPFDHFPGPPGAYPDTAEASGNSCKLVTDLGTAGGVAVDPAGRVYVAASSRGAIYRYSPPFPTAPDAAGGCGGRDSLGSPQADRVFGETFARSLATFSGLAMSPRGTLYAASVLTGQIFEYDLDGGRLRTVLDSPRWLPPHPHGTPQGLAVDSAGTLYYADLDLRREGLFGIDTGPDGKVWRIRFDADGAPLTPEKLLDGLSFPDGLGVLPGDLEPGLAGPRAR
jgi:DNA-binding beta-propeller fold protein YncE